VSAAAYDWAVLDGDALWWLRELPAASVDAIITDPPYGIGFMGHAWDRPTLDVQAGQRRKLGPEHWARRGRSKPRSQSGFSNAAGEAGRYDLSPAGIDAFREWTARWATEALRVLRPGGWLASFAATRTYHGMAYGLSDAGFEIRDQLAWLFGSGFPKSRELADGVGTALKPGHEPICLARAPLIGTAQATYDAHGTGGLNIADSLITVEDDDYARNCSGDRGHAGTRSIEDRGATDFRTGGGQAAKGRWPANVILDQAAAEQLDDQTGELRSGANPTRRGSDKFRSVYGEMTTVLAVYNSRGVVGRCDARCHDATSADCDCICGGRQPRLRDRRGDRSTPSSASRRLHRRAALAIFEMHHRVGATRVEAMPEIAQLGLDIGEAGGTR
jgi:hypothetical protein